MSYNGKFITFEGGEGSGKSTQCALLCQALQTAGAEVLQTREPGGTPLAERIRELVISSAGQMEGITEALLMFAARKEHVEQAIRPALEQGQIVVSDRYVDSSMAYQGFGREVGEMAIETLFALTCADILPDITFLLDIRPEEGLKRAKARKQNANDGFEAADLAFHRRVRDGFLHMAKAESSRFVVLDAAQPIAALHKQIVDAVSLRFGLKLTPHAA